MNQIEYQPLTIVRFGVKLRRMVETDKEIIRLGRNADFVRKNHFHRTIISPEEQDKWFLSMNSREHYVFIIIYKDRQVGVVYLRDVPENCASGTVGIFIWEEEFLASRIPVFAAFLALDFASYYCRVERISSIVLRSNLAGIKMYSFFGFNLEERDTDSYLISIGREAYLQRREALLNFFKRAVKNKAEHELRILGTISGLNHDCVNNLLSSI